MSSAGYARTDHESTYNNRTYIEKKALRTREVRRKKNLLYAVSIVIVLICIVALCVLLSNNPNHAEASESGSYVYTSIQLHEGDSLWSIAEEYHANFNGSLTEYVEEISRVNGLSDDSVEAGASLIIPVYRSSSN